MNLVLPLRVTWDLDGMSFNAADQFGCEWVVDTDTGWSGSASTRTNRTPKVGGHGSFRGAAYRDVRTIAITGYCAAPDPVARRLAERRIAGVCSDPTRLFSLRCNEETGSLTADVELDDEVVVTTLHERWFKWSLQLAAPDPRKYSVEWQTMSTGLAQDATSDGLDFSQVVAPDSAQGLWFGYGDDATGLTFGTSNATGFMNLTNVGSAPSFPVYTIFGPLTNPTLTTSSGSMRYNGALADGEFVTIDPAVPSVLVGGTASQRRNLNPAAFQAFAIPPASTDGTAGRLTVGLTHTGAITSVGRVEAAFRNAWF